MTIEENWPEIKRPLDSEVNMLDCKIDVNDKDNTIKLSLCVSEHLRFYYQDHHIIYNRLMKHVIEMH